MTRPERTLLFVVGATASKPLTPSHMKGIVWSETALRATRYLVQVDAIGNSARNLWDASLQTLRFWADLDEVPAQREDRFYADKDELWVGERYVEHSRRRPDIPAAALEAYRARIAEGWEHPSAARVRESWRRQYAMMGVEAPLIERDAPLSLSTAKALELLAEKDCVLDLRSARGGVYIDFTARGKPLRVLLDENGRDNYLLPMLRVLLGLRDEYQRIVVLCDVGSESDFSLITSALASTGASVSRLAMERVSLPDVVGTTREGGWRGLTCGEICARYQENVEPDVFRLALRLYFILYVPLKNDRCFSYDELGRAMLKAYKLARHFRSAPDYSPAEARETLARFLDTSFYRQVGLIDPHAVLSFLLTKTSLPRHAGLLRALCT